MTLRAPHQAFPTTLRAVPVRPGHSHFSFSDKVWRNHRSFAGCTSWIRDSSRR